MIRADICQMQTVSMFSTFLSLLLFLFSSFEIRMYWWLIQHFSGVFRLISFLLSGFIVRIKSEWYDISTEIKEPSKCDYVVGSSLDLWIWVYFDACLRFTSYVNDAFNFYQKMISCDITLICLCMLFIKKIKQQTANNVFKLLSWVKRICASDILCRINGES